MRITFITLSFFFCAFVCTGQTIDTSYFKTQDSICKYGKKYADPERIDIHFPVVKVSKKYKLAELHKAIPDSFNNDSDMEHPEQWWLYHYYFGLDHLLDYDENGDSLVQRPKPPLYYILNDNHFFDINGDGLLDFIHYPKYYMHIQRDMDAYEMFIQQPGGSYKIITFRGFITGITFNKDGTLKEMTTFTGPCCDDDHCTFYFYIFNKATNNLDLAKKETILTCQLKRK